MVYGVGQRDIYTLKGKSALGTHFITPFQAHSGDYFEQRGNGGWYAQGADQMDIVATEDGTTITANLTKDCVMANGTIIPAGIPRTFGPMMKGQTLTLREDTIGAPPGSWIEILTKKNQGSLAGSVITSDNPIAITTSEDCIGAANGVVTNPWAIDLAGDQIVPVDMVGKRYVVIRGYATIAERVDFVATKPATVITVHYLNGGTPASFSSPPLNTNDMWHVNMNLLPNGTVGDVSSDIFVDATEPVYCFQHSAVGGEIGGAMIPSIYSISQKQIDFYQADGTVNDIFLVFREDCDTTFTISYDGGPQADLRTVAIGGITPQQIPSGLVSEWRYAKVELPLTGNDKMVTIRNSESPFSLGYFNADGSTTSYGYLSGFGNFEFPEDTVWRCGSDVNRPVILSAGYAHSYQWTLPDGSIRTTQNIQATEVGMYILEMNQYPQILRDTCWVKNIVFDAEILRFPQVAAKAGIPQVFSVNTKGRVIPDLKYHWTFSNGAPAISNAASDTVVWYTTGPRTVTLNLSLTRGSGIYKITCDTTIVMELNIGSRYNGYFVDQHVVGGRQDGSSWENAFITIQEALDQASQGDYIWVAQGNYSPPTDMPYIIAYDSIKIYGGFAGNETDLSERIFKSYPTILNGNGNSVVKIDGSMIYTNYPPSHPCGVSTAMILDGFIIQNGDAEDGGGILFMNGATATISNCFIRNNKATNKGGGLYLTSPGCGHESPVFMNVEISGNTASKGGAIFNKGSNFLALNTTIGGNAANEAAGLYNDGGIPDIRNTIIWGNLTKKGANIVNETDKPIFRYSLIEGSNGSGASWNNALGIDGTKNIDGPPMFRKKGFEENGDRVQGDYNLFSSSRAINKGQNAFVYDTLPIIKVMDLISPVRNYKKQSLSNDLNGAIRVEDDIVDMGAYEHTISMIDPNIQREVHIPEVEGLITDPVAGEHFVKSSNDFIFTVWSKPGYSLDNLIIKTGENRWDQNEGVRMTKNEDGSITVRILQVTKPLFLSINGVSPVSNTDIDQQKIWSYDKNLYIQTEKEVMLQIYNTIGELNLQRKLHAGKTVVPLQQGFFMIRIGSKVYRIGIY